MANFGIGTLDGPGISLVVSNVHRVLQRSHEDLAVADLPGANRPLDGGDGLFDELARDRDLQTDSWQKVHHRFVSREELGAARATEAFDFRDRYPGDVELGQGLADLIEPEMLDER